MSEIEIGVIVVGEIVLRATGIKCTGMTTVVGVVIGIGSNENYIKNTREL